MPVLSIILPCYNEARGLPALLAAYAAAKGDCDCELILVDNGSKDDTQAVLARELPAYPFARCHQVIANKGYGDGILQGLKQARGTYLAWSHADLQTEPADVFRAFAQLEATANPQRTLIKGSRSGRTLGTRIITWGMQCVAVVCLRRWLHEINAQPKVFHRDLLDLLKNPPTDFNFDVYTLYQAKRSGWHFIAIPVHFPPRKYGLSNWSATWGSKLRTIRRSAWFMAKLGLGLWK